MARCLRTNYRRHKGLGGPEHSIERDLLDHAQNEKVDNLARRLMSEPAFTHGRVSHGKRMELARHLFPEEQADMLCDVVDKAENLLWLTDSGFFDR